MRLRHFPIWEMNYITDVLISAHLNIRANGTCSCFFQSLIDFNTMTSNSAVDLARAARLASVSMQSVTNEQKNEALLRIQKMLAERKDEIFEANRLDKKVTK